MIWLCSTPIITAQTVPHIFIKALAVGDGSCSRFFTPLPLLHPLLSLFLSHPFRVLSHFGHTNALKQSYNTPTLGDICHPSCTFVPSTCISASAGRRLEAEQIKVTAGSGHLIKSDLDWLSTTNLIFSNQTPDQHTASPCHLCHCKTLRGYLYIL